MFSDLFLWSNIVLLGAFILFVQFAAIVRSLLSSRQPLWKYALVVLALVLSLFSFVIAIHVSQDGQTLLEVTHEHLNLEVYLHLKALLFSAFASCMLQTCLLVIMIVLLWCMKRTLNACSTPVWVLVQDIGARL